MDTATRPAADVDGFLRAAAAAEFHGFVADGVLAPDARAFLTALFADMQGETSPEAVSDPLAMAHDFWIWAKAQPGQTQAARIRPASGQGGRPLGRTVLEIVGPDMPFLVDSVMGELADQGLAALALAHPIAAAPTGARSFIQVLLPQLGEARSEELLRGVRATLADVRSIVSDFAPLKARMLAAADELERAHTALTSEEVGEGVALLRWLAADRFTFLGARDYEYVRDASGELQAVEPTILEETGLGLLRDPERYVLRSSNEPLLLTPEWKRLLNEPTPLVVAKSTLRSRVHRRTAADYVGVKRYDAQGELKGETRFIGLFTTEAFTDPTREIPMLRRRAAWVVAHAGFRPGGHSEKSLRHVIETYPRDELWQMSREALLESAREIVHLMDRPRPAIFVRRDRFNRFVSAIAYLPKDRFNSTLREAVGARLIQAYGGYVDSFEPTLGESPLARVHYLIADIDRALPEPDLAALNADVAALSRTWEDSFADALLTAPAFSESARERVRTRFSGAFSAGYRERNSAQDALDDAVEILDARHDEAVRMRAFRRAGDAPDSLRCKIYVRGDLLPLSSTLPIFEHFGLFVGSEVNYRLSLAADEQAPALIVQIHDLDMRSADGAAIDLEQVTAAFEEAFEAVWTGQTESDGFNRVVLRLGVGWREAALLRALARYRQQTGLDPSQAVQEAALAAHPDIAALILALFRVRFDPSLPEDMPEDMPARTAWAHEISGKIETALKAVTSLDEDRVLRRMTALVDAAQRTNFYQKDSEGRAKPYISIKIASRELADLPAPKPYREIWISGPQVEGVHLRFGPIARGGLRWSDRRDDFRTEILDLVKAQQVKNAIIVPVGAKGGFFPKRLPARGAPNYQEEGVAAYRTFLRGLLDITDNLAGETVTPPKDVVRWDGDDPYLVVAADKGTATFSDIANALAVDYGFWLGDAFASGGSVGYDHKAMGITAKGAWEAVKRHFRELGKNIQEEAFDVIGVGDMSGDVFGNGMLLSKKIRLVAAFDHRHIFLDPNPADLDKSWAERKRLFDLPRSSWDDYDKSLLSQGGGVFARTLKSIAVTPEIAHLTGLTAVEVTPSELITALLKAECELLWFGGIGTFVKSHLESHADVGDKANDTQRVDGRDVRARVIGEGANLGVTQAGRVEFARKGGRINTDAVDNSAGVDTSDHEVNIKILLSDVIRSGDLKEKDRPALLAAMTDEVGALVLVDNYDQTGALSLSESTAVEDIDSHERFIARLEAAGKLSRAVEGLPTMDEFRALRAAHLGLTRPELSKLIAYAKIDLFDALMESDAPDDPAFHAPLVAYFPQQLHKYDAEIRRHRLHRALVATYLADDVINAGGPSFVDRVRETVSAEPVAIACAFEAARRIFDLKELGAEIDALDNRASAAVQIQLHQQIAAMLRRTIIYLVRHGNLFGRGLENAIAAYRAPIAALREAGEGALSEIERAGAAARRAHLVAAGAPDTIAAKIALLAPLAATLDIADLAERRRLPVLPTAYLYRAVGARLQLDALRAAAASLRLDAHWDRLAMRRTVESFFDTQRQLTDFAASKIGDSGALNDQKRAASAVDAWVNGLGPGVAASLSAIDQLGGDGGWTFAKLTLANAELSTIALAAGR